jgi:hypothetical protein
MPTKVRGRTSAVPDSAPARHDSPAAWLRRAVGLGLAMVAVLPVYRLLAHPDTGLAGSSTVAQLDTYHDLLVAGLLLLLPLFIVGARFVPMALERRIAGVGGWIARLPLLPFAAALALVSVALGSFFVLRVLEGLPNLIDAHAQLLHARFWAEGRLAGPASDGGGFWAIQNALFTERGWVSQYPPGHVAVLAAFMRLGAPWLAGPLLMGVTVFFGTLLMDRLLPDRTAVARFGAALLAVSPFFIALGASYMNHITTAAGVVVGAYALVRAWQGRPAWALVAGAAFGFALTARPLSTVAMAAALVLSVPFIAPAAGRGRRFITTGLLMAGGAAPFVVLLMAYNHYFFGSPFVFGYEVALGPQMSLGFHRDPWGNVYNLRAALGYTAADLLALGVNLIESPLSAALVIGVFLLLQPRLAPGERVLAAWAGAPVAANFFYWHHGLFMGPRMLHDAAPAWTFLFAVALVGLVHRLPTRMTFRGLSLRNGAVTAGAGGVVLALLFMTPQRLASYGGSWLPSMRTAAPAVNEPALVFVHGAWSGRIALTLAASGYRLDTIETLLRQNSTCSVHGLATVTAAGDTEAQQTILARLHTVPRARALPSMEIAPGNSVRMTPGEVLTPECQREVRSDAAGILDVAPFLWRGDLPGGQPRSALFVRDLGPERNVHLMLRHPGRTAWIYTMPDPRAASPVLLPYIEGMRRLWGPIPMADTVLH